MRRLRGASGATADFDGAPMKAAGAAVAPRARRSELGVRTTTGLVLIVVALGCIVYGRTPFWLLLSVAALTMLAEWASMIRVERWRMWTAFVGLALVLPFEQPHFDVPDLVPLLALLLFSGVVALVTRRAALAAGMLYAGLPTIALFYVSRQFDGVGIVLWAMSIVWATDIGAYFAGRAIGGAKLAPAISPNKTWAGLIGGVIAAEIVGFLLARILDVPLRLAFVAGLLAIAAQVGDLYESAMKRRANVKDSGRLLPGHGGVMDRLDGVVPVACIVAGLLVFGWV